MYLSGCLLQFWLYVEIFLRLVIIEDNTMDKNVKEELFVPQNGLNEIFNFTITHNRTELDLLIYDS